METIALIVAVYVISAVFVYSDGAWGFLYNVRKLQAVNNFGLLECFMCVAFWIALIACLITWSPIWVFFLAWGVPVVVDHLITAIKVKGV